jgi:hypothetical protein
LLAFAEAWEKGALGFRLHAEFEDELKVGKPALVELTQRNLEVLIIAEDDAVAILCARVGVS